VIDPERCSGEPPYPPFQPIPLRVEQDRVDFAGCFLIDRFPDLLGRRS